ncbi:MAG: ribulose-5-phosphate 4-epimerase/fuculose-1-phosphate aldolase [Parasphingorhabdus sp.]|jgi:ribulose-5-phosphate 4-epimerase/fuculose-1-phosphate aldolase
MTATISDKEMQVRQDLAACYRLFIKFGWTDLIFTHLSARVPDEPKHYLINPYGLLFQEITASNLIKVDFDGNVVAGDYPYNDAGHAIHSAVLKARPDVHSVLHSHTRAGIAVSCMKQGLLPLSQHAGELRDLVCYHPYGYAVDNEEECRRLGEDMADKWVMIMNNHGLLSAGRTIPEAFFFLYYLEIACKVQVDVLACNVETVYPDQATSDRLAGSLRPTADGPASFVMQSWDALIRQLDRENSNFRD